MQEQSVTFVGNLVEVPELRFTPAGHAVANFRVAVTQRRYDAATSAWVDGESWFARCTAWRALAENVAGLAKGARVIVVGAMVERKWDHDGVTRYSTEVQAADVGASCMFAAVTAQRATRSTASVPTGDLVGAPAF